VIRVGIDVLIYSVYSLHELPVVCVYFTGLLVYEVNMLTMAFVYLQAASIQKAINSQECATKEKHARGILCTVLI